MPETPSPFDEFVILELLGHRRVAGRLREVTLAGAGFLRLDEPDGRTQFVSPASVYAIHPTTAEVVNAVAASWRTEPVSRWELPAAPVARSHPLSSEEEADEMRSAAGEDADDYSSDYNDEGPF